jgi:hypothetical protein
MGLFGRRRTASQPAARVEESRFAPEARALGWEPIDDSMFKSDLYTAVYESARVLYGQAPEDTTHTDLPAGRTIYHDLFRTSVDGRRVVVANGSQNIVPHLFGGPHEVRTFSICVVELPSLWAVAAMQPRGLQHRAHLFTEYKTGNPEFDRAYRVYVGPLGEPGITTEMQRLVMARDDWAFRSVADGWFVCVAKDKYDFIDDMRDRIDDVLAIVGTIPESVLASGVDHSQDDLLARVARLESVEDAIAFLQQLTPADREELAKSPTPLAEFADVETPEQAIARFESLDERRRVEIITMFSRAEDA